MHSLSNNTCWDPLRKKEIAATPEEQVRQWFIMQLHNSFGVPLHMMMSEVGFTFGKKRYRADIVVYDRDGQALVVVECKQPEVSIGADVAEQALRYNSVLGVPFIILTNGHNTYIYRLNEGEFAPCDHIPSYNEMICQR